MILDHWAFSMKHLLQETEFGCIPTSYAMVLDIDVGILTGDVPEPWHFDSFNEILINMCRAPVVYVHNPPLDREGVLFLESGHAIAWDGTKGLDPNGGIIRELPPIDFMVVFFELI